MRITPIKNIEFKDDAFICPKEAGICISEFNLEFDEEIEYLEADHCECIHSLIYAKGKTLNIRLITDKNDIDEFIIITLKNKTLKIRFIR